MALCRHGIRFPSHGEYPSIKNTPIDSLVGMAVFWKYYHWGADRDCDKVSNATAEMDEYDANEWFCLSPEGKKIQKRQRSHVDMITSPPLIMHNSKHKCQKWLWQGGGAKKWSPNPKDRKKWRQERKSRESKYYQRTTTAATAAPAPTPTEGLQFMTVTVYQDATTTQVETWSRMAGLERRALPTLDVLPRASLPGPEPTPAPALAPWAEQEAEAWAEERKRNTGEERLEEEADSKLTLGLSKRLKKSARRRLRSKRERERDCTLDTQATYSSTQVLTSSLVPEASG